MLHSAVPPLHYEGSLNNLEDLRSQLTARLALLVTAASILSMWPFLWRPFSISAFMLLASLPVLGLGVQSLVSEHPLLARHLLIWGLSAVLLIAMGMFGLAWLPFLSLLLAFAGMMLIPVSGLIVSFLFGGAATWLMGSGPPLYPLWGFYVALGLTVSMAWLILRTLYTALHWAWTMQKRADRLLEEVRERQSELSRTLQSFEIANTILRRAERELFVAHKQADVARRVKEQFAANISHELRTPLNLILGFSEMMYLSPEVYGDLVWPPTLRRDIYQVFNSSRHLLDLIDDILALSRFEMTGFTLDKEPSCLADLLQSTAEIARDLFRNSPVRLEVDVPTDLPMLELDRTRIRQVLLNLLNNALRFTEEGTVRLAAVREDTQVVISVSDTGPGIPQDKLVSIFEEFYQEDLSIRRNHGGVGLGLAISKRFVDAHDGRIWAESEEGTGTTISFMLPIPGQYVPLSRLHIEKPIEPHWPELRPVVLVVDPDPDIAGLVRNEIEGYTVIHVESPLNWPSRSIFTIHRLSSTMCLRERVTPSSWNCRYRSSNAPCPARPGWPANWPWLPA